MPNCRKVITICCYLVIGIFLFGSQSTSYAAGATFKDVPSDHFAYDEINYLSGLGIIEGYSVNGGKEFRPGNTVTRAQAAKMLVSALGKKEVNPTKASFSDVPKGHWAYGWIESARSLGLINGTDGAYKPEDRLTRAQMSKIIAIAFNLDTKTATGKTQAFNDVSKDQWAFEYIQALYYNGVSNGNNNQFNPNSDINRGQFSAFLSRGLNDKFKVEVVEKEVPVQGVIANGKVTVSSLNMRASASASSTVVAKLTKGNIVSVHSISGYWAKVTYNKQTGYVHKSYLKMKSVNTGPLSNRIIVIDAGHGGKDPGAVNGKYNEKTTTLAVAKKVQAYLEKDGAKVIMTRQSDTYPTLSDRVVIAQDNYAELFVSIHVNSGPSTAKGTETYYYSGGENAEESKELAGDIQKQIVAMAKMVDRGVKDNSFYVIKNHTIPSVLVELGFITNSDDLSKLTSSQYQDIYAEAIYKGIKEYYSN
ncbi:N-acetylmuramoyl-L-alanine amidase [Peribacillus loiseleuriae]|uniref:N-acetylmuramoyl-L-alanine amidase n=1 Tax=Peribacillus loiseleuriae TaxID=1679170 RepID=UPI003D089FDA